MKDMKNQKDVKTPKDLEKEKEKAKRTGQEIKGSKPAPPSGPRPTKR